jgi:hypothetical protein
MIFVGFKAQSSAGYKGACKQNELGGRITKITKFKALMSYKNVEMNRLAVETGMALLNAVVVVKNVLIVLGQWAL